MTLFIVHWKDLFAIYMHILHICSTICMEDTERSKNASNIWSFRGFRTKQINRVRMPVGDFPTVFPTIMKCWLNRMVTALYAHIYALYLLHKCTCTYMLDVSRCSWIGGWRYCIFSAYSVNFYWFFFFADHEHVFFGKYTAKTANLNLQFTIRCCMFSAYHDIVYCSWKDLFAIYVRILHICSTGRHGTVENASRFLEF